MKINVNNSSITLTVGHPSQFPRDARPEIALSGRSNVGKSSLINTMLGRKSLARVSSAPGKTITVNFYNVDNKIMLVDLPGYGFAKRSPEDKKKWSALTDGYFTDNANIDRLQAVIQLIDSRVGPTADDEMMMSFMREAQIPFIIVATKTDKLNATEKKNNLEAIAAHPLAEGVDVIAFSSLKNVGKDELWRAILSYVRV